jgi:hypothetical protein
VAVPLGTYTGWNVTIPEYRDVKYLSGMVGGFERFPLTKEQRTQTKDVRPSIAERYTGREDYLDRVRQAADGLVRQRFLRAEDVAGVLQRADQMWTAVIAAASQ